MKLLKILNHNLTEKQLEELKEKWNVTEIVELSEENARKFGQVTKDSYRQVIEDIDKEIKQINPKFMFIQGQMGVIHNLIVLNPGVTPLFAMTERKSMEKMNPDGKVTKVNVFEHQCFMEY